MNWETSGNHRKLSHKTRRPQGDHTEITRLTILDAIRTCLSQRGENRASVFRVFVKRNFFGWGGVGWGC